MSEWWDPRVGTYIGAFGGAGLGVLGGLLGALTGTLAPKGVGRAFILTTHTTLLVVCVLCLGAGITALVIGQPYHVWYPLTLIGGIGTFVLGPLLFVVRKRYAEAEHRKMSAEQLRRG